MGKMEHFKTKPIKFSFILILVIFLIYSINAVGIEWEVEKEIPTLNDGFIIRESGSSEKSQEEIDCSNKGCFEENRCYSFGYVKGGRYCEEKARIYATTIYFSAFVNQSETGEACNQSYECKTNLCSDNICTNLTEQKREIESLKSEIKNLSSTIEELNETKENPEVEIQENKSLIQKIVDFVKGLFGLK